jgi:hypothetical protein
MERCPVGRGRERWAPDAVAAVTAQHSRGGAGCGRHAGYVYVWLLLHGRTSQLSPVMHEQPTGQKHMSMLQAVGPAVRTAHVKPSTDQHAQVLALPRVSAVIDSDHGAALPAPHRTMVTSQLSPATDHAALHAIAASMQLLITQTVV